MPLRNDGARKKRIPGFRKTRRERFLRVNDDERGKGTDIHADKSSKYSSIDFAVSGNEFSIKSQNYIYIFSRN